MSTDYEVALISGDYLHDINNKLASPLFPVVMTLNGESIMLPDTYFKYRLAKVFASLTPPETCNEFMEDKDDFLRAFIPVVKEVSPPLAFLLLRMGAQEIDKSTSLLDIFKRIAVTGNEKLLHFLLLLGLGPEDCLMCWYLDKDLFTRKEYISFRQLFSKCLQRAGRSVNRDRLRSSCQEHSEAIEQCLDIFAAEDVPEPTCHPCLFVNSLPSYGTENPDTCSRLFQLYTITLPFDKSTMIGSSLVSAGDNVLLWENGYRENLPWITIYRLYVVKFLGQANGEEAQFLVMPVDVLSLRDLSPDPDKIKRLAKITIELGLRVLSFNQQIYGLDYCTIHLPAHLVSEILNVDQSEWHIDAFGDTEIMENENKEYDILTTACLSSCSSMVTFDFSVGHGEGTGSIEFVDCGEFYWLFSQSMTCTVSPCIKIQSFIITKKDLHDVIRTLCGIAVKLVLPITHK
jgi:hypothetical protein